MLTVQLLHGEPIFFQASRCTATLGVVVLPGGEPPSVQACDNYGSATGTLAEVRAWLHSEVDKLMDSQLRQPEKGFTLPAAMCPQHTHTTKLAVACREGEDQLTKDAFYRAVDAFWRSLGKRATRITFSCRAYQMLQKQEWWHEDTSMNDLESYRRDFAKPKPFNMLGLIVSINPELPDQILYELD